MSDSKVTTSQTDMLTEVLTVDKEHYEPEDVYEFSNDRKFKSTDKTDHGVYDGT